MADSIIIKLEFDQRGAVTGAREVQKEVRTVGTEAQASQGKVGRFGRALSALRTLAPIAALLSLRNVFRQIGGAIRAASMQQIVDRRLARAITNTGASAAEAMPRLKGLADELQRTTNFANEQVQAGQAMLLSFKQVSGPEGAERLTKAMADLAAGSSRSTGQTMDLTQAAQMMGRAMEGQVGALTRSGISLTENQKAAFAAAEGLDRVAILAEIIESNYGGMAEAVADPVQMMRNQVGELSKAFGEELFPAASNAARSIAEFAAKPEVLSFFRGLGRLVVNVAKGLYEVVRAAIRTTIVIGSLDATFRLLTRSQKDTERQTSITARVIAWAAMQAGRLLAVLTLLPLTLARVEQAALRAALAIAQILPWGRTEEIRRGLERIDERVRRLNATFRENWNLHKTVAEAIKEHEASVEDLQKELARLADEVVSAAEGLDVGTAAKDRNRTAVERLEDANAALKQTYDELNGAGEERLVQLELERRAQERLVRALRLRVAVEASLREDDLAPLPAVLPGLQVGDEVDLDLERLNELVALLVQVEDVALSTEDAMLALASSFGGFADLAGEAMGRHSRAFFALSIAEAIASTYAGAARALKDFPWPLGGIMAASVVASGLAYVARIRRASSQADTAQSPRTSDRAVSVPARRRGGSVRRGDPYIVGEEGPELVVPRADGVVLPATVTDQVLHSLNMQQTSPPVHIHVENERSERFEIVDIDGFKVGRRVEEATRVRDRLLGRR